MEGENKMKQSQKVIYFVTQAMSRITALADIEDEEMVIAIGRDLYDKLKGIFEFEENKGIEEGSNSKK